MSDQHGGPNHKLRNLKFFCLSSSLFIFTVLAFVCALHQAPRLPSTAFVCALQLRLRALTINGTCLRSSASSAALVSFDRTQRGHLLRRKPVPPAITSSANREIIYAIKPAPSLNLLAKNVFCPSLLCVRVRQRVCHRSTIGAKFLRWVCCMKNGGDPLIFLQVWAHISMGKIHEIQ